MRGALEDSAATVAANGWKTNQARRAAAVKTVLDVGNVRINGRIRPVKVLGFALNTLRAIYVMKVCKVMSDGSVAAPRLYFFALIPTVGTVGYYLTPLRGCCSGKALVSCSLT
jgi:hypothetical protein